MAVEEVWKTCICSKTGDCWFPIILELKNSKLIGFDCFVNGPSLPRLSESFSLCHSYWESLTWTSLGLRLAFSGPSFGVRLWLFAVHGDNCLGNTPALTREIRKSGNLPRCGRADRDQHTANHPADQWASELDNIADGPCTSDSCCSPANWSISLTRFGLALWASQLSQSPTGKRSYESLEWLRTQRCLG